MSNATVSHTYVFILSPCAIKVPSNSQCLYFIGINFRLVLDSMIFIARLSHVIFPHVNHNSFFALTIIISLGVPSGISKSLNIASSHNSFSSNIRL